MRTYPLKPRLPLTKEEKREIEGEVMGVDPEGALLVRSAARVERVLAGDVTLLRERG